MNEFSGTERRSKVFIEKLSMFMVSVAALGAFIVLFDPKFVITIAGQTISLGGATGFSADLKGAVVSLILIGGWTAVKEYWLGSSAGSDKKSDAIQKMIDVPPPSDPTKGP
jgi:hypothetical protein